MMDMLPSDNTPSCTGNVYISGRVHYNVYFTEYEHFAIQILVTWGHCIIFFFHNHFILMVMINKVLKKSHVTKQT